MTDSITAALSGVVLGLLALGRTEPLRAPTSPPSFVAAARPLLIARYGGEQIEWTSELSSEWEDVMRCTGLDPAPDKNLRLFHLAASAPPLTSVAGGLAEGGWYDHVAHAVIVRSDLSDPGPVWRHEFLHARTMRRGHGKIFRTYAMQCRFASAHSKSARGAKQARG